ncbi:MAG: hypothetical protein IKC13_05385 [Elusimicrobiaceae bacterium]|nr:hypothetical protein [Elusimicrobiaceae bacterium]
MIKKIFVALFVLAGLSIGAWANSGKIEFAGKNYNLTKAESWNSKEFLASWTAEGDKSYLGKNIDIKYITGESADWRKIRYDVSCGNSQAEWVQKRRNITEIKGEYLEDGQMLYWIEMPPAGQSYPYPTFTIQRCTPQATITFTYNDTPENFGINKLFSQWILDMSVWIVPPQPNQL